MKAMRRTAFWQTYWRLLSVVMAVYLSACPEVCGQSKFEKPTVPSATISFGIANPSQRFGDDLSHSIPHSKPNERRNDTRYRVPDTTKRRKNTPSKFTTHRGQQTEEPIPPPTGSETTTETVTTADFTIPANADTQRATAEPPSMIPVVHKESASISTEPKEDVYVVQAGCSSCGTGGSWSSGIAGDHLGHRLFTSGCSNCGDQLCFPGQESCTPCGPQHTAGGRFLAGLYKCICCPDPCYDGKWIPIADSAFFVEAARPVSVTRLRWDSGINYRFPDRSEFFIPRADGMGKGPRPVAPAIAIPRLRYNQLNLYTEVASGKTGVIVEIPYRAINPDFAPAEAGFADMNIATKTFLFDCELLQVSFQFRTYLPIGQTLQGLGVGHVSLEPSLIFGIKLHEDGYLQGQIAEWIPIGGDTDFAGAVFHYHFAVNQVLYRILPEVPLIGTLELNGFVFQDGAFTDPILGQRAASETTHVSLGVGLRLFVCDKIDFGMGFAAALTENHMEDQLFRSEFRFRY
ncbi:MAG: hypothetical protein ACFCD0_08225 [Gemmataceae bacterium]